MLDLFNIPTNASSTQTFYAMGGTNDWQTWEKSRGAKMIQILCVGSGAGGTQAAAGVGGASGGRGGSSAGISRVMIPAFLLPDTLFIQVPVGGVIGGNGGISYVALAPVTTSSALVAASSATVAGPTTAATIATATAFNSLGLFISIAGVAGAAGGIQTTGPSTNALATTVLTGGAGGAGKISGGAFNGGNINGAGPLPTISGSIANATNTGNSGVYLLQPFCATGGAGGGSSTGNVGYNGGDGAYGCGGGGGGSARTTGGSGGKGGDGIVIITTIT
jgi:hypothetical protein